MRTQFKAENWLVELDSSQERATGEIKMVRLDACDAYTSQEDKCYHWLQCRG